MRHRPAARGLAALCAMLIAVGPAYADECVPQIENYDDPQQLAKGERTLRDNLGREACIANPRVRYTLAYVVYRQLEKQPKRACEAYELFSKALELLPESERMIRDTSQRYRAEAARTCCHMPLTDLAEGRWLGAIESIDARLQAPECAPSVPSLLLARGQALDRVSGDDPQRACEAAEAYALARRVNRGPAKREAEAGERKMKALCAIVPKLREDCRTPGDEDGDGMADCADPDCAAAAQCAPPKVERSGVPTGLAIGAGVAALACGGLYLGAWKASKDAGEAGERYLAAGTAYKDAHDAGDVDGKTAAQADIDRALEDRDESLTQLELLNGLAIASGVIALGLATGAVFTWGDTVEVEPRVSANGGGLLIRF